MEIYIQKTTFLKALGFVSGVTTQKTNAMPILGNVLLETEGQDTVRLIGTDLEVGVSTKVPARVVKEGSITVPCKKLTEIIREVADGEVEIIVAKNNAVNIRAAMGYFKIIGLTKEDYPKLPKFDPQAGVEIEQSLLKESLGLTSFAISNDETRYVLNGILVSLKGDKMRFVATDGRRLAFVEKEIQTHKPTADFEIIVPIKAVQELLKLLSWDGVVKIILSQNQIVFHLGDSYLVSRLIEGHFPNYEQVIPKGEKTISHANREELLQAVKRTSLLTSAESPAVKMDFVKGKILISSRSPNIGEAKEELSAETNGEDIAIGFNPHYLVDVLKNLDVEKVSLSLTDPDKPGLIKGKDNYLYVIMPMQLN